MRYYHNRGHTTFEGESSRMGDFAGLDDLMTEHPDVVAGFIEIYKDWISEYRVDGFRIDTAKHVNPEFWQAFTPAIIDHAKSLGIEHFHVFGESYEFDPASLAAFTTRDSLPTVLDFAFQGRIRDVVVDGKPARDIDRLFEADHVYAEGFETAKRLPTFVGNHDMGRFAGFLRAADPDMGEDEIMERTLLAHSLLFFARGVPTIYYGDEQGFVSDGHDRAARENMFASRVPDYNDNELVGTDATTAEANFDREHPLYTALRGMAEIRMQEPGLRHGTQIVRHSDLEGGALVLSRKHDGVEIVIGFNAEDEARALAFPVDGRSSTWTALHGKCRESAPAAGTYELTIPARGYVVCKSGQ
jgi:glycosidase